MACVKAQRTAGKSWIDLHANPNLSSPRWFPSGIKREHGADDDRQCRGCPRNCKRRAASTMPLGAWTREGGKPRRPASQETCHHGRQSGSVGRGVPACEPRDARRVPAMTWSTARRNVPCCTQSDACSTSSSRGLKAAAHRHLWPCSRSSMSAPGSGRSSPSTTSRSCSASPFVVYGLGLRHAVDADHIAAIDNVTRKLMQDEPAAGLGRLLLRHGPFGRRHRRRRRSSPSPRRCSADLSAFESDRRHHQHQRLGAVPARHRGDEHRHLRSIYRSYRARARRRGLCRGGSRSAAQQSWAALPRIFRPHVPAGQPRAGTCCRSASSSAWASTPQPRSPCSAFRPPRPPRALPIEAILVFPVLFAAGMSLVDTTDGVVMLGAYDWAFVKPMRKLYYNMTITLVSVVVAVLIGGIEALGLIGDKLALSGGFWDAIGTLNRQLQQPGLCHHRRLHRCLGRVPRRLQMEAPGRTRRPPVLTPVSRKNCRHAYHREADG